jgi:hypothetical protein
MNKQFDYKANADAGNFGSSMHDIKAESRVKPVKNEEPNSSYPQLSHIIGVSDGKNGSWEPADVRLFVICKEELLLLVKHWAKVIDDLNWQINYTGGISGSQSAEMGFANSRISNIACILGNEVVKLAIDAVMQEGKQSDTLNPTDSTPPKNIHEAAENNRQSGGHFGGQ